MLPKRLYNSKSITNRYVCDMCGQNIKRIRTYSNIKFKY